MNKNWAWILALSFMAKTSFALKLAHTHINDACTPQEKILWGLSIPEEIKYWIKIHQGDPESHTQFIVETFLHKNQVRSKKYSEETLSLLSYTIYRNYFEMGLVHFAYRGFLQMIQGSFKNPQTLGAQIGAIGCINRIREQYPFLKLDLNLSSHLAEISIPSIWPEQRQEVWQILVALVLKKLYAAKATSSPISLQAESALLAKSGPYALYASSISNLLAGNEAGAAQRLEKLLKNPKLPRSIQLHHAELELLLARTLYNLRQFKASLEHYEKIPSTSNLIVPALLEKGWVYLRMKQWSKALSAASNLLFGELRYSFTPDAYLIAGIAWFETCHIKEVLSILRAFRHRYDVLYHWLYNLRKKELESSADSKPTILSFYPSIIELLENAAKSKTPKTIGSEWLASPFFLGWQSELNLYLDESNLAQKLSTILLKKPSTLKNVLIQAFKQFMIEAHSSENLIVNKINQEISNINQNLIKAWTASFENSQLLQSDTYEVQGKEIITDLRKDLTKKEAPESVSHDQNGLTILQWGTFSAEELSRNSEREFFEDEVGTFQTNIKSICKVAEKKK